MIRYRVTATMHGKRVATRIAFVKKDRAQDYADRTNRMMSGANARVVKDSEKIRRLIP